MHLATKQSAFAADYVPDNELPNIVADEMPDQQGMGVLAGLSGAHSNWHRPSFYQWLAPEVQAGDGTVLRSDEVTREAISFSERPVVIEITDEQAAQLQQFHDRGSAAE